MSYIGATPTSTAFLTDSFSGDGSTTSFTLSAAPASSSSILVAVSGVLQDPATYAVVGTALNFTGAPPSGTANISVRYLGIPASNISTAAYRTVTEFTATAGQTSFSTPSYTVGFINVYRNGVLLGSADYTATTGTTVVLASGATAGDLITTESFYVSSIYNAISNTAGSVNSNNIADGAVTPSELSTGGPYWDTSSNFGIGTSSPSQKLDVAGSAIIGNTSGNQGLLIGNASGNSGAYVNYLSSSAVVNWQVGSNIINSGSLTFTPSTATGGSTFTTPAGRFDSAGNFHFNSGYGSTAIAYGCRAWVNFNGSGTVAIRASGNVSSITDNGTGDYTVNFTTSMPDTNYNICGTAQEISGTGLPVFSPYQTSPSATGSIRVRTANASVTLVDPAIVSVSIFR